MKLVIFHLLGFNLLSLCRIAIFRLYFFGIWIGEYLLNYECDFSGVYETDIDLKQQKVVVKGNVESETLIKKLLKTGKHAELWPEKGKSKGKSKKKEKHSDSESSDESSGHEDEKEKVKFEVQDPTKNGDAAGKIINGDGGGQAKQPGNPPAGDGQTSGGGGKKEEEKEEEERRRWR